MKQISAHTHSGRAHKFGDNRPNKSPKLSLSARTLRRDRLWPIDPNLTAKPDEAVEGPPPAPSEDAIEQRRSAIARAARATVHEIRQPLVGVITNAGAALRWLDHSPPSLQEARAALERVIRDGRRAGDILERIHSLFAGTPGERAQVDLNTVAREALINVQKAVREHGVAVTCVLDPDLPPVVGDRVQLEQCVFNLLINAVEALATIRDRPRRVGIRSFVAGPAHVAIEVADSGPAFEPTVIERMFDPVFSTKPSGMGVGLSICRMIVEAHGGLVVASLGHPHGAVFRITLPFLPEATA